MFLPITTHPSMETRKFALDGLGEPCIFDILWKDAEAIAFLQR
jgi:hypothetical protein